MLIDRVQETTTTTGTGSFTLAGAVAGYQSFSNGVGIGNTCYYCCAESNDDWEIGIGTLTDATTLARTTILRSSNSDNVVDFGPAVTKQIFVTFPADKAMYANASGDFVLPANTKIGFGSDGISTSYIENDGNDLVLYSDRYVAINSLGVGINGAAVAGYPATLYQSTDNKGFRLYGFDDKAASYISVSLDSGGGTNLTTSDYLRFDTGTGHSVFLDYGGSLFIRDRDASYVNRLVIDSAASPATGRIVAAENSTTTLVMGAGNQASQGFNGTNYVTTVTGGIQLAPTTGVGIGGAPVAGYPLTAYQTADSQGSKLFGFDDKSSSSLHAYIDSLGGSNFSSSGYMIFFSGDLFSMQSGAGKAMYFTYGEKLYLRDKDAADAVRVAIDSAASPATGRVVIPENATNTLVMGAGNQASQGFNGTNYVNTVTGGIQLAPTTGVGIGGVPTTHNLTVYSTVDLKGLQIQNASGNIIIAPRTSGRVDCLSSGEQFWTSGGNMTFRATGFVYIDSTDTLVLRDSDAAYATRITFDSAASPATGRIVIPEDATNSIVLGAGNDLAIGFDGTDGTWNQNLHLTGSNPKLYFNGGVNYYLWLDGSGVTKFDIAGPFQVIHDFPIVAGDQIRLGYSGNPAVVGLTDTDAEQAALAVRPNILQTGTANYVGILLDVLATSVGSGQDYLMDLRLGGTSKFAVASDGSVGINGAPVAGYPLVLRQTADNQAVEGFGYDDMAAENFILGITASGGTWLRASKGISFTTGISSLVDFTLGGQFSIRDADLGGTPYRLQIDSAASPATGRMVIAEDAANSIVLGAGNDVPIGFDGNRLTIPAYILSSRTVDQTTYPSIDIAQYATNYDGQFTTGTDEALDNLWEAVKFTASQDFGLRSIALRLKASAPLTNGTTHSVRIYLYTDNAGQPGTEIAQTGNFVYFSEITTNYATYTRSFGATQNLTNGTSYWIVLRLSAIPTGGILYSDGKNTGTAVHAYSANGSAWTTENSKQLYFYSIGNTYIGLRAYSLNASNTIYGESATGIGVYGVATQGGTGVQAYSGSGTALRASSNYGSGAYCTSTESHGVQGTSVNGIGVYGTSTNGTGVSGSSSNQYAATFLRNTTTATTPVFYTAQNHASDTQTLARFRQLGSGLILDLQGNSSTTVASVAKGGEFGIGGAPVAGYPLTAYQTADAQGWKLFGFDDQSSAYIQVYLNASGTSVIDASGQLYISSTGLATHYAGGNQVFQGINLIFDPTNIFQIRDPDAAFASRLYIDSAATPATGRVVIPEDSTNAIVLGAGNDLPLGYNGTGLQIGGVVGINGAPVAGYPLTAYQSADSKGIKLFGYDDQSAKFGQFHLDSAGGLNIIGTGGIVCDSNVSTAFSAVNNVNFAAGLTFRFLDRDAASAERVVIDSAATPAVGRIVIPEDATNSIVLGAGDDISIGFNGTNLVLTQASGSFYMNDKFNISYLGYLTWSVGSSCTLHFLSSSTYKTNGLALFQANTNRTSGNAFHFEASSPGTSGDLTDTDAEQAWMKITPSINQSGTANYVGLLMDVTETSTGSGQDYLMDLRISTTSKFAVKSDGGVVVPSIKSGATQGAAGASAGELWKTSSHATLPDNVVMIGV